VSENQLKQAGRKPFDLLIVPNAAHVEASTASAIQAYLEKGGRLALVGADSLRFDERNRPLPDAQRSAIVEHPRTTTLSGDASAAQIRDALLPLLDGLSRDRVTLIDAATGQPVFGVEWRSVWHQGDLLINMANYSNITKTVTVRVNGQPIGAWEELIGGESGQGATFNLQPEHPMLLRIAKATAKGKAEPK